MKNIIEHLVRYYGSRKEVAKKLEVSERHIYNIQKNDKVGVHLRKEVERLWNQIRSLR